VADLLHEQIERREAMTRMTARRLPG